MKEPAEPPRFHIRAAAPGDIEDLCAISLATGDRGGDASALYRDPRLIGLIYAAPYVTHAPGACLVAHDNTGLVGFAVGTRDTRAFERRLEEAWWPALRDRYPEPPGDSGGWDADQRRHAMMHHPVPAPDAVVVDYPAHMHVNLLSRARGCGLGRLLVQRWLDHARGSRVTGVHIAANRSNAGALAFWPRLGFKPLHDLADAQPSRHIWLGRKIAFEPQP